MPKKPLLDFAFFSVVKNPFDLRSQIRVQILPQKNTPYPTGYCAGKNIENCCSFGCFIKAMDRIFMGLPRKAYKSPPARDLQAFLVLYQHSKWV